MNTFWAILCFVVYAVNTDLSGHSALAMSSPHAQDPPEISGKTETEEMPSAMLQELLWFFRREESTTWNYCILGLSVLVLLVGIVLLWKNIAANRAQKIALMHQEAYAAGQPDETEMKQAFVPLKEDNNSGSPPENFLPKVENAGQVTIHWKDGNITTMFADAPEEDA
ncbi:organic solute transporter subunit beta isoform X2 [Podarcis muralis]|uniref:organic solute transporter subunit beta isoform X1 n=2 Tax=Podarcis muralis TaxID=64176 RepID=UPI00109F5184|nr:organic solute transporter subunit beta isoform X1 [Podarcis muralis]